MHTQLNFWLYWFTFCGIILSGYFISASGVYWLLYSRVLRYPTVQDSPSRLKNHAQVNEGSITIAADIKRSVISVVCFALGAAVFMGFYNCGLTQVYLKFETSDLAYIALSYGLVLFLQDTFFYFTHRLFHHSPSLFRRFHQGHHLSKPPTPWTFFALEPFEAMAQIFFLLLLTLFIPLHTGVLVAILFTMTIWSMGNHLGFQVVPASRLSRWWGHWCIGATHHLVHHQRFNRHFGLYFTFWDKLLKTQDSGYESKLY